MHSMQNYNIFLFILHLACHASCQGVGQGACTGPDSSDCCPYFNSTTKKCITSCEVYNPITFECGEPNSYNI